MSRLKEEQVWEVGLKGGISSYLTLILRSLTVIREETLSRKSDICVWS